MSEVVHKVTMPKWGLSMQEGTVVAWLVDEGAEIAAGDEIVEIETEKLNNVFEAPVGGVLRRQVAGVGTTLPVGGLIGVIAGSDATDAAIESLVAQFEADFVPEALAAEGPVPQQVEIGGRRINYLVMGDGAATSLLLIHGFGGDLTTWMFNQSALAETRPVIALDLLGHGASDKQVGAGDVPAFAEIVLGLLDDLAIDRAHLAGHSLGGAVALELALVNSGRIASLALLAPAGLGREIDGDYIARFIAADRRKAAKEVLGHLVHDPALVSRDMVENLLRYKRTDGVGEALSKIADAVFDEGGQAISYGDRLGDVAAPILCLWGADDAIIPPKHAAALPKIAEIHVLNDAGHLLQMEQASAVNGLINAFVSTSD